MAAGHTTTARRLEEENGPYSINTNNEDRKMAGKAGLGEGQGGRTHPVLSQINVTAWHPSSQGMT